jgi:hypothetical protein
MSNPSSALENCTEVLSHPRTTVSANGRSATFLNPDRTKIKRIDLDCWLSSVETAKADFLVSKPGVVDVIVELKGKDIHHAIEQILATLALWKKASPIVPNFGGLVIFTRSPERSTMLDNIKAHLLEKHKIWLQMGKSGLKDYKFESFTGKRA